MNDDRIRDLLKRADEAAAPPEVNSNIVGGVQRKVIRRRVALIALSGAAAVAVVILAITRLHVPGSMEKRDGRTFVKRPSTLETRPALVLADPIELNIRAQAHEQIAERLWAAERQRQKQARAEGAADPLAAIERGRDRAALIAVDRADQLARQQDLSAAAREYQQTIRLFPQTHWAAVARQRLAQIENRKEG